VIHAAREWVARKRADPAKRTEIANELTVTAAAPELIAESVPDSQAVTLEAATEEGNSEDAEAE
jgi:hypothetical protein